MKIIVVSYNDSDNLSIQNVLIELKKRGHCITIFTPWMNDNCIRMFKELKVPIKPFSDLDEKCVLEYDVAFCAQMMMHRMRLFSIYCFVYSQILEDSFITDGADFLFTCKKIDAVEADYKCAKMVVGNPKNDTKTSITVREKKSILYVDSGHMPFGHTGKKQIAETILRICDKYPEYEICIKPRWLRDKGIQYTHKNTEHIYDVIEELCAGAIPSNLNMLNEHLDLQELIDSSVSVITLYSAAHLDVIQRDKGLLILSGWDNEDKFDMRKEGTIKQQHDLYSESGCVIDYRDVLNYLPFGIKAQKSYIEKMIPYDSGASVRIVEVIENTYERFISRGKFPLQKEYVYETYKEEMKADTSLTMEALKRERVYACLVQEGFLLKNKLAGGADFSQYYIWLKNTKEAYELEAEAIKEYVMMAQEQRNNVLINSMECLMQNDINQSLLFKALYENGHDDTIFRLPEEKVLCIGVFHYYLGMVFRKRDEKYEAVRHFLLYLQDIYSRKYERYMQDGIAWAKDAYNCIFDYYDGENVDAGSFALLYSNLFAGNNELKVKFGCRRKAHSLLPRTAQRLSEIDLQLSYQCLELYARQAPHYISTPINQRLYSLRCDYDRINNSLSYKIGFFLTLGPRKIRKAYREVNKNGMKFVCSQVMFKVKDIITRTHAYKIADKYFHMVLGGYQLYSDFLGKYGINMELLLSAPATGDGYIYAMQFNDYVKRNHFHKRAVYGVFGNSSVVIGKMFGITDMVALTLDEYKLLYNLLMFTGSENVFIESMHYHVFYRHTSILTYIEGLHNFDFFSLSKAYLGIESENVLRLPIFNEDHKYIEDTMNQADCISSATIVLAPYAKTVKLMPMSFWEHLAKKLLELGFCVCTNSIGNEEPPIWNTKPIFIPYDRLVPFVEQAGAVIGVRSGFLDVTSTAKCLKVSICMENNYKRSPIWHISDIFSLSKMYGQPKQYDLLFSPEKSDELVNEIIKMVIKHVRIPKRRCQADG